MIGTPADVERNAITTLSCVRAGGDGMRFSVSYWLLMQHTLAINWRLRWLSLPVMRRGYADTVGWALIRAADQRE